MEFIRYDDLDKYRATVLPVLLEDETANNLPVSIISDNSSKPNLDWLMGAVTDGSGRIILVAFCSKPFNMLLYLSRTAAGESADAIRILSDALRRSFFNPPGVFAKKEIAEEFIRDYAKDGSGIKISDCRPMILMKLKHLNPYNRAGGMCRVLVESDLTFVPIWEQDFCKECNIPVSSVEDIEARIRTRLGRNTHFIWEDTVPVAQAVFGRETQNTAVINWVYTPPQYRGRGYATSVVAQLAQSLSGRSKKSCILFADAGNKTSRGIYNKLGFRDLYTFLDVSFVV